MELISKSEIQQYAKRNTSPKFPIEEKYVYSFIDALMNSSDLQDLYEILKDEMRNGDSFIIFNSFNRNARNINKEPYRSIIAYSMLKKDIRLFQLISSSMFTGKVLEYHGSDLYTDATKNTDEIPLKYTDSGVFTDMSEGLIQIGFQNYFIEEPAEDGGGSEYQTLDEMLKMMNEFDYIITLTKPARVEVLIFYVPYCYLSGTDTEIYSTGIDRDYTNFSCPFGDPVSMEILDGFTDNEIVELYREVRMKDLKTKTERSIEEERSVVIGDGFIMFSYDLKCQSSIVDNKELIWSEIDILSNTAEKTYIQEKIYEPNNQHYEKYIPIMLRLYDNDPDGPCLAMQIENGICTVGAMFYTRETIRR